MLRCLSASHAHPSSAALFYWYHHPDCASVVSVLLLFIVLPQRRRKSVEWRNTSRRSELIYKEHQFIYKLLQSFPKSYFDPHTHTCSIYSHTGKKRKTISAFMWTQGNWIPVVVQVHEMHMDPVDWLESAQNPPLQTHTDPVYLSVIGKMRRHRNASLPESLGRQNPKWRFILVSSFLSSFLSPYMFATCAIINPELTLPLRCF